MAPMSYAPVGISEHCRADVVNGQAVAYCKRVCRASILALLEIFPPLRHRVGDVRKAQQWHIPGSRERIEGSGFHLYGKNLALSCGIDGLRSFAKRRVRRPSRAD